MKEDTLTLVPAQQLSPKKTTVRSNQQPVHQLDGLKVINKIQVGDVVRYLKVSNSRGKILLVDSSNIKDIDNTAKTVNLIERIIDIPNEEKARLATRLLSKPSDIYIVGYAIETPSGYYIIQRSPSSIFPIEINLVFNSEGYQHHIESEMIIYPIVNPSHINDNEVNVLYDRIREEERSKCQEFLNSTRITVLSLVNTLDKYIKAQNKFFDKLDQVISDFEKIQDEYIGVDIDEKDRENLMLLTKTLRERQEIMIDIIRSCQNVNNIRSYLEQVTKNIDTYIREISKVFENIEFAIKE
jgi:cell division protein ZapA (FtsZ GTPase activity inhibitor)